MSCNDKQGSFENEKIQNEVEKTKVIDYVHNTKDNKSSEYKICFSSKKSSFDILNSHYCLPNKAGAAIFVRSEVQFYVGKSTAGSVVN